MRFQDRREAGRALAEHLAYLAGDDVVVAALVRGGMPVAVEVSRALDALLEALVVRKVGAPFNPEFGIGAVSEEGHVVRNQRALETANVDEAQFRQLAEEQQAEVERRVSLYRGDRPRERFEGRTVVVVDDGLATGVSATAGVEVARQMGAEKVVLAVPVGAPESVRRLEDVADEVVCPERPADFRAVGSWYVDFAQVSDDDVKQILDAARSGSPPG